MGLGLPDDRFWQQTFRTFRAIIRGRGKALREQSIVQAFDLARIQGDAQSGKARSLGGYLEELLPDDERSARNADRFFDTLDRQIAAGEATQQ